MARLLRPVTKIISVMPAAAASSTAYWINGLSTMGSISLGLALVTGRKRLPRPATGNTALVMGFMKYLDCGYQVGHWGAATQHTESAVRCPMSYYRLGRVRANPLRRRPARPAR